MPCTAFISCVNKPIFYRHSPTSTVTILHLGPTCQVTDRQCTEGVLTGTARRPRPRRVQTRTCRLPITALPDRNPPPLETAQPACVCRSDDMRAVLLQPSLPLTCLWGVGRPIVLQRYAPDARDSSGPPSATTISHHKVAIGHGRGRTVVVQYRKRAVCTRRPMRRRGEDDVAIPDGQPFCPFLLSCSGRLR